MNFRKLVIPTMFLLIVLTSIQTEAQDKNKKDDVFFVVDEMPVYPGGDLQLRTDIANAVKYPPEAKTKGIQGKVYITFVVNTDGKIIDSKVARGVDPIIDKEALRVMNDLKIWEPGKQNGKVVKVSYTVPINFVLNGEKSKDKVQQTKAKNLDKMVFRIVEDMPQFPGGDAALKTFISQNVKYPEEAKKGGIQGKVYVVFVVSKDGKVINAQIARGVDPTLDKEALRVVSSLPNWKPGSQRGIAVNVEFTVPIAFALD